MVVRRGVSDQSITLEEFARTFAEMRCPDEHWLSTKDGDGIWRQMYVGPDAVERRGAWWVSFR